MSKSFLLIITILITYVSNAQLGIGIKGAVGVSSISTSSDNINSVLKTGIQFGGFVRLGEKIHLQTEIYFSTKNGKFEFDYNEPLDPDNPENTVVKAVNQDVKLSTIDVPVLIGYRIFKLPTLNVHIQAGPVASIVVNKKMNVSFDGVDVEDDQSPILADDFSNINWGLQFGAGVDFLFLTADIRYELGLNNIYKAPDTMTQDPTMKNNVFFISVGWKIL